MGFFSGASNITILGGDFNDIRGNLTIFDHSRHTTNSNSNNAYNTNVLNSHNNNSTTFNGWVPRDGDEEDHQMPSISSRAAGYRERYHTTPAPPRRPELNPQQITSAGGTVINVDSHNVKNSTIDDAFNNNSKNYYKGPAPPIQKGHNGPPWMDPAGPQSTSGPHGSQFTAPVPFQATLPQQTSIGGPSGQYMSVNDALIQPMDQHMQRNFEKLLKFTISQTQSMVAGISGANNNPEVACPSLLNVEENSINTRMGNLSLVDSSSASTEFTHPGTSPQLSPPPPFSRNKSDPQIGLKVTPPDQMDTSNPSCSDLSPYSNAIQQASRSNPSLAPHMNEQSMVDFLALPPATQHYGNNPNGPPPPVSTSPFNFPPSSNGGPNFKTYHGSVTKHDHSVHQTNIDSFNQENNTIQDSFNDNSFVNSTGKPLATDSKKRGLSEADPPIKSSKKRNNGEKTSFGPNRMDEVDSSDESDEESSPSAVVSPRKRKGLGKLFPQRWSSEGSRSK